MHTCYWLHSRKYPADRCFEANAGSLTTTKLPQFGPLRHASDSSAQRMQRRCCARSVAAFLTHVRPIGGQSAQRFEAYLQKEKERKAPKKHTWLVARNSVQAVGSSSKLLVSS